MRLFRKFRSSLVLQIGFMVLMMLMIVWGAGLTVLYYFTWHLLNDSVNENAEQICWEKVNQFDQPFFQAEAYANILASFLAEHPRQNWPDVLNSALKSIAAADGKNILAVAAATIPDNTNGKLFVIQRNPTQYGSQSGNDKFQILTRTEYTDESWFADVVKDGKGKWIEPFRGHLVHEQIAVYSHPVFQTLPGGEKKIIGVVCIDMGVQWIDTTLRKLQLPYSGTAFLLSKGMQILSMPQNALAGKNFIEGTFRMRSHSAQGNVEKIEQVVKSKKSAHFTLYNSMTGEPSRIFLCPMKSTGWSFGIVYEESQLGTPLSLLHIGFGVIAVLSGGIVILFVLKIGRRVTLLLKEIKLFSREIGKGNLSAPIPGTAWKGEFLVLIAAIDRMRRSLAEYIVRIRQDAEQSERMENELLIAQKIQYGLVPNINPASFISDYFEASARLLTAKEIGGDFYDCSIVNPGLLGFTIGDVSGKGIPASLFMVFAQIVQRILRGDGKIPSNILVDKMNRILLAQNKGRLFVTFVGGFINAETGVVNYCNAGHPPFFVLKNDGTLLKSGSRNGIPLGLKKEISYTESRCRLEPGESLVLYTDGITDAEDSDGNFFGIERFSALLRECAGKGFTTDEIVLRIMRAVCKFSRVNDRSDDIACMVIRYKKAAPSPPSVQ